MKRFFFSLIALSAAAIGCTQSAVLDSPDLQGTEVSFSPYTGRTPLTKAQSIEDPSGLNANGGFNVISFLNKQNNDGSTSSTLFMPNVNVYMERNTWTYKDIVYWPDESSNFTLSFAAYSDNAEPYITPPDPNVLTKTFTVPDRVGQQVDLLATNYQSGLKRTDNGGTVTLDFKHLLSRVGFKLVSTTIDEDVDVVIKSVKLTGKFPVSGTVDLGTEENIKIVAENNDTEVSYELMDFTGDASIDGSFITTASTTPVAIYANCVTPVEVKKGTEYTPLVEATVTANAASRHMMIMPHKVKEGDKDCADKIVVTYVITDAKQRTAEIPLPENFEFVASRAYEFYLTVSTKSISFTVKEYDWNEEPEVEKPITPAESAIKITGAVENVAAGTATITAEVKTAEYKTISLETLSVSGIWEPIPNTELSYEENKVEYVFNNVAVIPNQAYSFRIAAITQDDEEVWSSVYTFNTQPAVLTLGVDEDDIEPYKATLNGSFPESNGSLDLSNIGFYYSKSSDTGADGSLSGQPGSAFLTSPSAINAGDSFYAEVKELEPNTEYHYQAYAKNVKGLEVYGNLSSFKTRMATPEVKTMPVTNIDKRSATINGKLTNNGGDLDTKLGFACSMDENNLGSISWIINSNDGNKAKVPSGHEFDYTLRDLQPNTKYYFQAYAENRANEDGYDNNDEGGIENFITRPEALTKIVKYGATTVDLEAPDNKLGQKERDDVSMGFYVSNTKPTEVGANLSSLPESEYTDYNAKNSSETVTVNDDGTIKITILSEPSSEDTMPTFYIQAYVENETGSAFGEILSFTVTESDQPIPDWENGNGSGDTIE